MYGHQNSSFYWVELNIILFFLILENFNFSAHCTLYFRTEGVYKELHGRDTTHDTASTH